jgi:hypothetical protein
MSQEDPILRDHVERGGGLVGDQERRSEGQRHGHQRALPHAATELVRVVLRARGVDPHQREQVAGARSRLASSDALVRDEHLLDLSSDAEHRVEGVHRGLRHERDLLPANGAHVHLVERDQIPPVEANGAAVDAALGGSTFTMARPTVVLPQPDSSTRPTVSPRAILNETPSNARTIPTDVRYDTRKSSTASNGVIIGRAASGWRSPRRLGPRSRRP